MLIKYFIVTSKVIINFLSSLLDLKYFCSQHDIFATSIDAGSNLLIDNQGNLKLAAFGLASSFSGDHNANLTHCVITLLV